MNLNEELNKFKNISLDLKSAIEEYELEVIEELLSKREDVMKAVYKDGFAKEQVTAKARELGVLQLEEDLKLLMIQKRNEAKEHLNSGVKNKQAYNTYNRRNTYGGSFISGNV